MGNLAGAGQSVVVGAEGIADGLFKASENLRHLAYRHRDSSGKTVVGHNDFTRSAGYGRSGEYARLGNGSGVARHLPGKQLVLLIEDAGLGEGVNIQVHRFAHVQRQGGNFGAVSLNQHAIGLGIDGDRSRHGEGRRVVQGDFIFPGLIRRGKDGALQRLGLAVRRGDHKAGLIGGDGIIMLIKGVGPHGDSGAL